MWNVSAASAYSKLVWSHKGNKAATNGSALLLVGVPTPDQFSNGSSAYSKLVWSHKGSKVATNGKGAALLRVCKYAEKLQTNFQTGLKVSAIIRLRKQKRNSRIRLLLKINRQEKDEMTLNPGIYRLKLAG